MPLNIREICQNIASLYVAHVRILSYDQIPESVVDRDCPLMYPRPDDFVTEFEVEINSFGSSAAKKTVYYTLNYVFLEAQLGVDRGLFEVYADFVDHLFSIWDVLIANDALAGQIDLQPQTIVRMGVVYDPGGTAFHGAQLPIRIMEFVN